MCFCERAEGKKGGGGGRDKKELESVRCEEVMKQEYSSEVDSDDKVDSQRGKRIISQADYWFAFQSD